MHFEKPSPSRDILIEELFAQVVSKNPDYPYTYILEDDSSQDSIRMVTWHRFWSDARSVASELSKEIPIRKYGEPLRTVGLFARSRYTFAVHWLALILNGCTVSNFLTVAQAKQCHTQFNSSPLGSADLCT